MPGYKLVYKSVMRCVGFIISIATSVMNIIYSILTILCGYLVDISTFSKEFQYEVGTFIAAVFYCTVVIMVIRIATGLSMSNPAFWVTLAALMLSSSLFHGYYYTKHPIVTRRSIEVHVRMILKLINDEVDASAGKEQKFDEMTCAVCKAEKKTVLLQPCNHLCLCVSCVKPVLKYNRICPICREHVVQWTKIYY